MSEPHLRLFIALPVPDRVKADLAKVQGDFRRALPRSRITWTRCEQLHLTLKFLGNVEARLVEPLTSALLGCCRDFVPFTVRASGIGCFPDCRAPRVLWVGLRDDQNRLAELQKAVETATKEFTFEQPEKNFTGHVTLARVKHLHPSERPGFATAIADRTNLFFGEWAVPEVQLIRSQLSSGGPCYTLQASVPLGHPQGLPDQAGPPR